MCEITYYNEEQQVETMVCDLLDMYSYIHSLGNTYISSKIVNQGGQR
jgi:hypothetical protein